MNTLDYLDKESPEILGALQHGFRKGDADAVGRTLVEEIKARKILVKNLHVKLDAIEKALPVINERIDFVTNQATTPTTPPPAPAPAVPVSNDLELRLNELEDRINIISNGLATIIGGLTN